MNINKRLGVIEEELGLAGVEAKLQRAIRQQEMMKFFYQNPRPTQTEMVERARWKNKDERYTEAQYKDNLNVFLRLVAQHNDLNFHEKRKAELSRRWT